jgi:hypothetical protein
MEPKTKIQLKYYLFMGGIVVVLYGIYYMKAIPLFAFIGAAFVALLVLTYLERKEFEEKLDEYDEFYEPPYEEEPDDYDPDEESRGDYGEEPERYVGEYYPYEDADYDTSGEETT